MAEVDENNIAPDPPAPKPKPGKPAPKPDDSGDPSDVTSAHLEEWAEFKDRNPTLFGKAAPIVPDPSTRQDDGPVKHACGIGPLCVDWRE